MKSKCFKFESRLDHLDLFDSDLVHAADVDPREARLSTWRTLWGCIILWADRSHRAGRENGEAHINLQSELQEGRLAKVTTISNVRHKASRRDFKYSRLPCLHCRLSLLQWRANVGKILRLCAGRLGIIKWRLIMTRRMTRSLEGLRVDRTLGRHHAVSDHEALLPRPLLNPLGALNSRLPLKRSELAQRMRSTRATKSELYRSLPSWNRAPGWDNQTQRGRANSSDTVTALRTVSERSKMLNDMEVDQGRKQGGMMVGWERCAACGNYLERLLMPRRNSSSRQKDVEENERASGGHVCLSSCAQSPLTLAARSSSKRHL